MCYLQAQHKTKTLSLLFQFQDDESQAFKQVQAVLEPGTPWGCRGHAAGPESVAILTAGREIRGGLPLEDLGDALYLETWKEL